MKTALPPGPVSVEPLAAKIARPHKDAWFVSDVHQRHAGKIVFSGQLIDPPKEPESQFRSAFSRGERLYARVYLDRSLPNTPVAVPGMRAIYPAEAAHFIRMFVDGKPFDGGAGILHGASHVSSSAAEDKQLTTWRADLSPAVEPGESPTELAIAWARAVNKLKPGKRRIRLELWGGDLQQHTKSPRAVGELTLNVGKSDFIGCGRPAPVEGYKGTDKETLRADAKKLFSTAEPPFAAERVVILKAWSQRLQPGVRFLLVAGRAADPDGDRVCEWRVMQLRQAGGRGAWRATRRVDCLMPECVPVVANCD